LIKRFVEAGGFIFAEACCGSPNFDRGFKEWVKNEWDQDLTYVESTHPVWTCYREVQPGQPFKLMELKVGCRTVMLYSPQDLSCQWESNQHDGFARPAFWLGSNIVAFATGRTPPLPRLTPVDVPTEKQLAEPRKRGAFQVRQLRFGNDWYPATKALTNLLDNVEQSLGLEVQPRAQTITFGDASDLRTAKFIYMHGRNDFRVDVNRLEPLRFTLQHGGLLLADACCGDKQFDKAFRKFAQDLFPKEKLTRVPADAKTRDPLFGAGLNDGMELSAKNIQCRTKATGPMQAMEPYLEGIRVNGRWVVLYSPYDLGTALAKSASSDCVGYDADSALRIALAAVRYNTRP
jgi:hypothetical protein